MSEMQGMGRTSKSQRSDDGMSEDEITTGASTPGTGSTFGPATANETQGDDSSGFHFQSAAERAERARMADMAVNHDHELFTSTVSRYATSEYTASQLLKTAKVQCRSASLEHHTSHPSYSQWSAAVQSARQALNKAKEILEPGSKLAADPFILGYNLAVDSFITPTFRAMAIDHNDQRPRTIEALRGELRIAENTCQREELALKVYDESRPKDASTDLVIRSA